jgi:zinc transporter ZupT
MPAWFSQLHPVAQALLAGVFTWAVAAGGAALVFFARSINRKLLDSMLGFSGGVMLAASYWSLLAPAIEISEHGTLPAWLPASVGLLLGAAAVVYAAPILPYALSFAAGAMIYVVVEELIPESHAVGNVDLATVSFIGGFVVMMTLDVALGQR